MIVKIVILLIHRSYSNTAATEMSSNPLKHRFGPSVLAILKCATAITDLVGDFLDHHPVWSRRLAALYAISFSAAASIASLVTLAPQWGQAPKILMHLDKICMIFESAEPAQVTKFLVSLG